MLTSLKVFSLALAEQERLQTGTLPARAPISLISVHIHCCECNIPSVDVTQVSDLGN